MTSSFKIIPPSSPAVPVVVSVPHCGVVFPEEIRDDYRPDIIKSPDDTDWFVDTLYDFAPSMGMTMVTAVYSRWVIDLNRDPTSKPLYTDGRIITGLCPTTNFLGEAIYKDGRSEVVAAEINRRLQLYYWPYHQALEDKLRELKSIFGKVLLWDCHSIRQIVPSIQKEKFPDLILGSADDRSASSELIQLALHHLRSHNYSLNHNHPFKGGFITRNFGKPDTNQHALQLEMAKVNYMDDSETRYDYSRAGKIRELLKNTLGALAEKLCT